MTTTVTHQPRPVPAFRRQHSTSIAYPSSPRIPNPSQSALSFPSSRDLHSRPYRPNRLPQFFSSDHHIPDTPRHPRHPFYPHQERPNASLPRHASPSLSSTYPLVYTPSEHSYQNTPSMSADIPREHPFDIGFATGPSIAFSDLDLSQSAFLNPGQLPWSESISEFKVESPRARHPVFHVDTAGSHAFYDDSNGAPINAQLSSSQPRPQSPLEMLSTALQNGLRLSPAAESEMEGGPELQNPTSPPPHGLPASALPSDVTPPSPPAFGALELFPRVHGSSTPLGLTDEDFGSDSGESEASDEDDDGNFLTNRTSRTCSRRTRSVSVSSGSGSVRPIRLCRLIAPVPVPNLTKKSRGRRLPTAPVFIVQGGVQKNMRMYRCTVQGCFKCFARGEHLKRHVRSIHTNERLHQCPVEGCGKDFSRHDNLGQHMRIRKGQAMANAVDA